MKRIYILFALLLSFSVVSCVEETEVMMLDDMSINPSEIVLEEGGSMGLELVYSPADYKSGSIKWDSSDKSVATVDQNGQIVALKAGKTVISAIVDGVMALCDVEVLATLDGISLNETSLTLPSGDSFQLVASFSPEDVEVKDLVWSSSDENIASVDQDGMITGLGEGTAVIKVSSGEVEATCEVTVVLVAKVGDFFYSDGTWSSELDQSKEVVGIVFWSGNPCQDDPLLKKDYPECTRGLAIALTEEAMVYQVESSKYYMESGYKGYIQSWIDASGLDCEPIMTGLAVGDCANIVRGYNNTTALVAFNEDESNAQWKLSPIEYLSEFRSQNALPSNTSGWFMPSLKELTLLSEGDFLETVFYHSYACEQLEVINNALSKVDGAMPISVTDYWSSTEYYLQCSMCALGYDGDYPGGSPTSFSEYICRFVFAF